MDCSKFSLPFPTLRFEPALTGACIHAETQLRPLTRALKGGYDTRFSFKYKGDKLYVRSTSYIPYPAPSIGELTAHLFFHKFTYTSVLRAFSTHYSTDLYVKRGGILSSPFVYIHFCTGGILSSP